jgi:peptidoglycan/LPS O-acetylase OafA/YrhL
VRSLAAAGVTALVLVAIGTSDLSPLQWIAGAVLGTGAFVGGLLASRELSLGEFRLLASRPLQALRANK